MKISIITVSFNSSSTIRDTIESILSQTYSNIEYIVVDGGSRDKTIDVLKDQEPKFNGRMHWVSEKDSGIYDAMNKGIMATTGDVIGILNSDDLYNDTKVIEAVMNEFKQNPSFDIVYGDLVYVKNNNINEVVRNWKSSSYYNSFFENGNVPPHPSLFVKKKVYEKAGHLNLDFKLASDYEFMLRIFKKHQFTSNYINKVIVRMRLGGVTNKSFSNIIKQNIEILKAWNHNGLKVPFFLILLRFWKRLIQFTK
jgi:glycosyltransferase involved in cell wall biosynthesis